jgi:hypothetical protein
MGIFTLNFGGSVAFGEFSPEKKKLLGSTTLNYPY